jgi:hypothetical protein
VFSTITALDSDILFDYEVTVGKDDCWRAVEVKDPDSFKHLGRLSGCVTAWDNALADKHDEDGDGWGDDTEES